MTGNKDASDNKIYEGYSSCRLCPRQCGVNRNAGKKGFCGAGADIKVARAALHMWEEPCISAKGGSGTVFFSNCTLRCCYCQNYKISSEGFGREVNPERLSEIFLELQEKGAENISLVTATHYLYGVLRALDISRHKLKIPVVYNCGGYERVETLELLKDYVDIYLPDLKYHDSALSEKYSLAADYFDRAMEAIACMIEQKGGENMKTPPEGESLKEGVIVRHMVLPSHRDDSINILRHMAKELPKGRYLISLMSQYTPFYKACEYKEINRRVTSFEYDSVVKEAIGLGLTEGYMQERSSAKEEYTPPFDLEGI